MWEEPGPPGSRTITGRSTSLSSSKTTRAPSTSKKIRVPFTDASKEPLAGDGLYRPGVAPASAVRRFVVAEPPVLHRTVVRTGSEVRPEGDRRVVRASHLR